MKYGIHTGRGRIKIRLACLGLILAWLSLTCMGYGEESAVVVQAGDIRYTADQIQMEVDALIQSYGETSAEMTEEARENIAAEVVNRYAMLALVKLRLRDLKKEAPDENTMYALRAQAQEQYEKYWQALRATEESKKMTDEQITQSMLENGVTLDMVYGEALDNWQVGTLLDYYKVDLSVTDEEVMNYYMESYVKPCEERYADNVPLFEEEILYGDGASAYAPEGYRLLYQIVIPIPEDIRSELDAIEAEGEAHLKKAEDTYNEIAKKAVAGEDVTELREVYQAEANAVDQLQVKYGELWRTIPAAVQEITDEIYARIELGETFESLMSGEDANSFLLYHPDSAIWPDDMRSAADKLENPGDISLPVLTLEGVSILYFDHEVPGGAMEPEEKDMAVFRYELEQTRLMVKLNELTEPWREEYGLTIDMSKIRY